VKAIERYRRFFGHLENLAEAPPWTEGVSNLVDWLVWSTRHVLGVNKTQYWKQIVAWCDEEALRELSTVDKQKVIGKRLGDVIRESEATDRFDPPKNSIAGPREALRRVRYFSEDYLNKEFDICWSLVSNGYLDGLYGEFFDFIPGSGWSSHGNGNLFVASVGIGSMQMDNLSYNAAAGLLVANELKLGGKKNPDQILKYASLFGELENRGFVEPRTRFAFLLFGDREETHDWEDLIEQEIGYCCSAGKTELVSPRNLSTAQRMSFGAISWLELVQFNERYLITHPENGEVERNLLAGFNVSLRRRKLIMGDAVEM
jgi:hypothetical protein